MMRALKNIVIRSVFIWLVAVSLAGAEPATDILHGSGLLWKIEKRNIGSSFIFGTIHLSDPRVTQLPAPVDKAFYDASRFVMEMLLNARALQVISNATFFDDGRTLDLLMQPEDYEALLAVARENGLLPENTIKNMKPWAVLMMMLPGKSDSGSQEVLDMELYHDAQKRNIPVRGLETAEEQIAIFDALTMHEQIWLLNRSVQEFDRASVDMKKMIQAYLDRDLAQLVRIQQLYMYPDSNIDDKLMYAMLQARNHFMADRMQTDLQAGNAFIAIGALHLPGKEGVLHLLEQKGYKVSAVY